MAAKGGGREGRGGGGAEGEEGGEESVVVGERFSKLAAPKVFSGRRNLCEVLVGFLMILPATVNAVQLDQQHQVIQIQCDYKKKLKPKLKPKPNQN